MLLAFSVISLLSAVIVNVADSTSVLVARGDSVNLRCPYSATSRIDWAKVIPGQQSASESYERIVTDCWVMSNYASLYEAKAAADRFYGCDLVILNAGKPHGGRYVCYDERQSMSAEIRLSVIETNVTGSQTSVNAVGGDVVNLTCYIEYYGDASPDLLWSTHSPGWISHTQLNRTVNWEYTSVSVEVPDGPAIVSDTCRVTTDSGRWSNIYFWPATDITVSYCPKNVRITGARSGSSVAGGTVLTCVGEGHPPPSYMWTNAVDNSTVEGPTFTVAAKKHYKLMCTAMNDITFANGTTQTCSKDSSSYYYALNGFGEAVTTCNSCMLLIGVITATKYFQNLFM